MIDSSVFEQPLNERIRALLRLQQLFERIDFHVPRESVWNTHAAVNALLEVSAFTTRIDVKSEVMKELERQSSALQQLKDLPNVDRTQLASLLDNQKLLIKELHDQKGQLGYHLVHNEFLKSIRQRSASSQSPFSFELPGYHQWLRRPVAERQQTLYNWLAPFSAVKEGIQMALEVVRQSGSFRETRAPNGFYQMSLNTDKPLQLLRIRLPEDVPLFPEVSAGKHRFTIRFLNQPSPDHKATQEENDVHFQLACCGI